MWFLQQTLTLAGHDNSSPFCSRSEQPGSALALLEGISKVACQDLKREIKMTCESETLQWNTGERATEKLQATPVLAGPLATSVLWGWAQLPLHLPRQKRLYWIWG